MAIPVGLVGAGRARNGLGPFLARFLEQAGCRVAAVAGRNEARAAANARELGAALGHEVVACPDVAALCRSGIRALVVATPNEHHRAALEQALAARLPTLCDKPLVTAAETAAGLQLLAGYAGAAVPLVENCQWPHVLPALFALHGELRGRRPERVAMGLSPMAPGPGMVADTLSHLLSVVQALWSPGPGCEVAESAAWRGGEDPFAFTLREGKARVRCELHLRPCREQPRPAWVEVDGRRMDREIGPGYAWSFGAGGRSVPVEDPLRQVVYGFAALLGGIDHDRIRAELAAIRTRLRLYGDLLAAGGGAPG